MSLTRQRQEALEKIRGTSHVSPHIKGRAQELVTSADDLNPDVVVGLILSIQHASETLEAMIYPPRHDED